MYYYDNDYRILVTEPHRLRVYSVITNETGNLELSLRFTINSMDPCGEKQNQNQHDELETDNTTKTQSGRIIRPSKLLDISEVSSESLQESIISSVDYEDEIDVLVVAMHKAAFLYSNSSKFLKNQQFSRLIFE